MAAPAPLVGLNTSHGDILNIRYLFTVVCLMALALTALHSAADESAPCEGTVLQRRVALVSLGERAQAYLAINPVLPELCDGFVTGVSDHIPALLKNAEVCGSSHLQNIYYACLFEESEVDAQGNLELVTEICRYSLLDASLACEHKILVTSFTEEPDTSAN